MGGGNGESLGGKYVHGGSRGGMGCGAELVGWRCLEKARW